MTLDVYSSRLGDYRRTASGSWGCLAVIARDLIAAWTGQLGERSCENATFGVRCRGLHAEQRVEAIE